MKPKSKLFAAFIIVIVTALITSNLAAQVFIKNSSDDTTMAIMENGNVGIGIENPQQKLDVDGTVNATFFTGNGSGLTGTGDNLGNHTATQNIRLSGSWLSNDGGNEGVFVNTNGYVGVGTSNPNATFETYKNLYIGGDGNVDTYETIGTLGWYNNDANSLNQLIGGIKMVNTNGWWDPDINRLDAAITFNTMENSIVAEVMRVDYNGNVGIGITNPGFKLEVNGTFQADNVRSGAFDLPTANGPAGQFLSYNGTWAAPAPGNDHDWGVNGNDVYTGTGGIYPSGNVGIGTTTPGGTARLEIANIAGGISGIKVNAPGQNGLWVETPTVNGIYVNTPGYYGFAVTNPTLGGVFVDNSSDNGIVIDNSAGNGIFIDHSTENGIRIYNSNYWGIHIDSAGFSGMKIADCDNYGIDIYSSGHHGIQITDAGEDGVYVASADDDGIHVHSADDHGIYVESADNDGVHVASSVNTALYGDTDNYNGEWGVYTPDKIYGSNVTSKSMSVYCYNKGSVTLEPGDVVSISSGYKDNVLGINGTPVIAISKANQQNSEALIGVVEYKVTIEEKPADGKEGALKRFKYDGESVYPGDYLSIIVFGMADVKMHSQNKIRVGQKLTVSNIDGAARQISQTDSWTTGILGKALENSNGRGMMKVFVNCK